MERLKHRKENTERKEQPKSGVQEIFDRHRKKTSLSKFERNRNKLIRWGILCAAIVIVVIYLCLPSSRVKAVSVSGTKYLDKTYIEEVAGIQENDVFYLTVPTYVEHKLKSDPMIQDASVSLENGNIISISVTEKKAVGYRYDSTAEILLGDNTTAELKSDYLDIIANVPYIEGFTSKKETRLLCKALNKVDQEMIENISEITQYSLSYDDNAMKILMRNGGYFVGSFYNLDKLNQYYAIYNNMTDKSLCISADDNNDVAWQEVCPWNQTSSTTEYWTNSDGTAVTNKYGDQVKKNYYQKADGTDALDAAGNKIPIPIDSDGNEVIDGDFESNYANGYYSTGTLSIPSGG